MFFSVLTKNLNWEILTKDVVAVTFKRWDGVKDEKLQYYGGSLKNSIFRKGVTKNQYIRGKCLKRGAWATCRFKRGLSKKEGEVCFRGGRVDTSMHTMKDFIWKTFRIWGFLDIRNLKTEPFLATLPERYKTARTQDKFKLQKHMTNSKIGNHD